MSDHEHEAFIGAYTDHLYADCPSIRGSEPKRCADPVDPMGSDICGMCQYRWRRQHREAS